jgi:hypothetical protein
VTNNLDVLTDVFKRLPVQAKCEAHEEGSPWKVYVRIYGAGDHFSGNQRARIEFERRLIERGETVAHGAFICISTGNYCVDLLSKTFTVLPGKNEIGFDLRSMFPGLRVTEVTHEEPDPNLFLITADLKQVKPDTAVC